VSRPQPTGFDASLRFELASQENRPLLLSYLFASLPALAWLVLVHVVAPLPLPPLLANPDLPTITFEPAPAPRATPSTEMRADRLGRVKSATASADARGTRDFPDFFRGTAGLVDAGTILHGVDIQATRSSAGDPDRLKVGLESGTGSRTPGRSASGGLSGPDARVGTVRGGGVSRHVLTIGAPEVRAVPGGAVGGDATEVGRTARAHVPQLARCYHGEGLARNPSLAGLVRLAIVVEGGRVTSAAIVERTWSGAGAAETETCLLSTVRAWRLGSNDARILLPLSFTSPVHPSP
jgi:hypothetical protein